MILTPIKAIRAKCLDCCCGSSHEVKLCTAVKCALYPYRFGKRPKTDTDTTPTGKIPHPADSPRIFTAEAKKESPLV